MLLIPCCICVNRIKHWLCPCTCLSVCLSVCLSLKCLTHIVASFSGHSDSPGKVASIPHLGGGGESGLGTRLFPTLLPASGHIHLKLGFQCGPGKRQGCSYTAPDCESYPCMHSCLLQVGWRKKCTTDCP